MTPNPVAEKISALMNDPMATSADAFEILPLCLAEIRRLDDLVPKTLPDGSRANNMGGRVHWKVENGICMIGSNSRGWEQAAVTPAELYQRVASGEFFLCDENGRRIVEACK